MGIEARLEEAGRRSGYPEEYGDWRELCRDGLSAICTLKGKLKAAEAQVETLTAGLDAARDEAESIGMDKAADFIFSRLSKALGSPDWLPIDGTETWDGDVAGTVYSILYAAGVIDQYTGELATARARASDTARASAEAELADLVKTATLLQQNSVGCAMNHYGNDCELHGLPGWLADTEKSIIRARAALEQKP